MQIIKSPKKLKNLSSALKQKGKRIGFVPTMGALHQGHLSLVDRARKQNDIVIVSIFVNPLQFGPNEDYSRYPKTWLQDKANLIKRKVDYLFFPSVEDFYSGTFDSVISAGAQGLQNKLCGKHRPGHFDGVTTVVAKLFHLTQADHAYFGQKDLQQSCIIKKMVKDLDFTQKIKVLPIVREKDGLAMSSRNQYLSEKDRLRALSLSLTLKQMKKEFRHSKKSVAEIRRAGTQSLKKSVDRVDYLEVIDPETLESIKNRQKKIAIAVAAYVGKTRLIDNVIIRNS